MQDENEKPNMSIDRKESIQKYLKEKALEVGTPGMSAVFSALKDVDGIEKAKFAKGKVKRENN